MNISFYRKVPLRISNASVRIRSWSASLWIGAGGFQLVYHFSIWCELWIAIFMRASRYSIASLWSYSISSTRNVSRTTNGVRIILKTTLAMLSSSFVKRYQYRRRSCSIPLLVLGDSGESDQQNIYMSHINISYSLSLSALQYPVYFQNIYQD